MKDYNDMVYVPPGAPQPTEPAYSEDGVDLTLIRWMLALTPEERLRVLQERQDAIESVREANPGWTFEPS